MSTVSDPQETTTLRYQQAIGLALTEEMRRDERVFTMGTDIATMGGFFAVGKELAAEFGTERVRNTAIVEPFMVGAAAGAAMAGTVPVVDLAFSDFLLITANEICNNLAKWRYMHGGRFTLPATIIAGYGVEGAAGAEHSASPEAVFVHHPGLRVVTPSTPADAKGLLKSAIRDPNPVIFLPHKKLMWERGEVPVDPDFTVPFGEAAVRREGTTVSVITYGRCVGLALEAAKILESEGIDVEVLDLRTLAPLDSDAIIASVEKTSRAVVLHDAVRTGGIGGEIAAQIQERALFSLEAPILRICGTDTPIPQNGHLIDFTVPSTGDVVSAIRELVRSSS